MDALTPLMATAVAALIGRGGLVQHHARTRAARASATARAARTRHATTTGAGPVRPAAAWAACERAGWQHLLETGELRRVAAAPDPGNPGQHLVLAEHPTGGFGAVRVLLAVNAAPSPDGGHATVALPVPDHFADPVTAAAWTYHDPDHPLPTTRAAYTHMYRRT